MRQSSFLFSLIGSCAMIDAGSDLCVTFLRRRCEVVKHRAGWNARARAAWAERDQRRSDLRQADHH